MTIATSYENLTSNSPDGAMIGSGALEKVSFYGKVPVVQRPYSSAKHATSAASSSTDFGATQLVILQEVMNTFIGLGIWATV